MASNNHTKDEEEDDGQYRSVQAVKFDRESNQKPSSRFTSLNDYLKRTYGSTLSDERPDSASKYKNQRERSGDDSSANPANSDETRPLLGLFGNNNKNDGTTDDSGELPSSTGNDSEQNGGIFQFSLRRIALELSLWTNVLITLTKLVAYIRTLSLSVLAALLDSILDIVSQLVLNFTEKYSSMQRSSALYPAGASRLEPIGVLTCAALMGMASFEVLKESFEALLITKESSLNDLTQSQGYFSCGSMMSIVIVKLLLLALCKRASHKRTYGSSKGVQRDDPTMEALAQDHWNDALSNGVSAVALFLALYKQSLWWVDPFGAIIISFYIIYSWYHTGYEQIEQLTGKSAPQEFIDEVKELATNFDPRIQKVDAMRVYHFGPKFLVELEVVMPRNTPLKESHDLGMELQYEIESREEVERCFVHIDYESRDYDEHVVSKVPELREHLSKHRNRKIYRSAQSV